MLGDVYKRQPIDSETLEEFLKWEHLAMEERQSPLRDVTSAKETYEEALKAERRRELLSQPRQGRLPAPYEFAPREGVLPRPPLEEDTLYEPSGGPVSPELEATRMRWAAQHPLSPHSVVRRDRPLSPYDAARRGVSPAEPHTKSSIEDAIVDDTIKDLYRATDKARLKEGGQDV